MTATEQEKRLVKYYMISVMLVILSFTVVMLWKNGEYQALHVMRNMLTLAVSIITTAIFAGLPRSFRSHLTLLFTAFLCYRLQLLVIRIGGVVPAGRLYPIHTHFILFLVLLFGFRRKLSETVFAILMGYMSSGIPRWFAEIGKMIDGEAVDGAGICEMLIYIAVSSLVLFFFMKKAVIPVTYILSLTTGAKLTAISLPAIFYVYEYIIYGCGDLIDTDSELVSLFMPTILGLLFPMVLVAMGKEMRRSAAAIKDQEMLTSRLTASENGYMALKKLQTNAAVYRHDMRHHLNVLNSFAEHGELEKIRDYIRENMEDLDSITPRHFCDVEMLDIIFSHFADVAERKDVEYTVNVSMVRERCPLSDPELCSIVSNSLENALVAVRGLSKEKRKVSVKLCEYNGKIVYTVENPYEGAIEFKDGMPVSRNSGEGHGYGTKSIAAIAANHEGTSMFTAEDGKFVCIVVIPMF